MNNIKQVNEFIWEMDNHPDIAHYGFCTNDLFISFWMLIRQTFSLELTALIGYGKPVNASVKSSWLQKIKFIINAYTYRPKLFKTDFLFISPSIGNVDHGHFVQNIYHDLFAERLITQGKKVLILEQPNKLWSSFKKRLNIKAYSLTWSYLIKKIYSCTPFFFVKPNHRDIDRFLIFLETQLHQRIDDPRELIKNIKHILRNTVNNIPGYIRMWEHIIHLTKPKYVVMQDICCGGSNALAALIFKQKKIILIEDQHGIIDAQDIQFNYGKNLHEHKPFSHFFPDFYFLYGEQWLRNINIQTKKIIIGNAYFSQAKSRVITEKTQYDLLVISDSMRPKFTEEKLQSILKYPYKILFRPHPRELSYADNRYGNLLDHPQITLDHNRDVYQSIAKCKVVIGILGSCLSTVICEAFALGKNVLCFCDNVTFLRGKEMFFNNVSFYEEDDALLADLQLIINKDLPNMTDSESLYALNWKENLDDWLLKND